MLPALLVLLFGAFLALDVIGRDTGPDPLCGGSPWRLFLFCVVIGGGHRKLFMALWQRFFGD